MVTNKTKKGKTVISLKNREVIESLQLFGVLDECVFNAQTLLNMVKTGLALKQASEAVMQVRDKIAKEYFEDGKIDSNKPEFQAYKAKVETVLDETTDFEVVKISEEDLNLEKNKIPVGALIVLNWFIDFA